MRSQMQRGIFAILAAAIMMLSMAACDTAPVPVDTTVTRSQEATGVWSSITEYTLEEMAQTAHTVVLADVEGILPYEEQETPLFTALTVIETWKGTASGTIYVKDNGFIRTVGPDDPALSDPNAATAECSAGGVPILRAGNRVVLFLEEYAAAESLQGDVPCFSVVAVGGKYFYDTDGSYHNELTYSPYYETLKVERRVIASGYLSFDDHAPKTLEELQALV